MRVKFVPYMIILSVLIPSIFLGILISNMSSSQLAISRYPWLFEGAYVSYYTDTIHLPIDYISKYNDNIGRNVYFGWNITKIGKDFFSALVWIQFEVGDKIVYKEKGIKVDLESFIAYEGEQNLGNWYLALNPAHFQVNGRIKLFEGIVQRFSVNAFTLSLKEGFKNFTSKDIHNIQAALKQGQEIPLLIDVSRYPKSLNIDRDNYLNKYYKIKTHDLVYVSIVRTLTNDEFSYITQYTANKSGSFFGLTALGYALIYHKPTGILLSGILMPLDTVYYHLFGVYWFNMDRSIRSNDWLLFRGAFMLYDTNILN